MARWLAVAGGLWIVSAGVLGAMEQRVRAQRELALQLGAQAEQLQKLLRDAHVDVDPERAGLSLEEFTPAEDEGWLTPGHRVFHVNAAAATAQELERLTAQGEGEDGEPGLAIRVDAQGRFVGLAAEGTRTR